MQKGQYFRPYKLVNGKAVYLHKGPTDIGKSAIPLKDRCEDFDELWNQTFMQVMKYWEFVPVTDIHEFDKYEEREEIDPGH